MSNEATGDVDRPVEERVRVLEQIVTLITDRQADLDRLTHAAKDLTKGVKGVDNTLTNVGTLMVQVQEARELALDVAANQVPREEIDEGHADVQRKAGRWAVELALVVLVVSIAAVIYNRVYFNDFNHKQAESRYLSCQNRNAQAAYSVRVFAAIKDHDPALARAIEQIPAPSAPLVVCVKP